jgi:hypothetical protein
MTPGMDFNALARSASDLAPKVTDFKLTAKTRGHQEEASPRGFGGRTCRWPGFPAGTAGAQSWSLHHGASVVSTVLPEAYSVNNLAI